MTKIKDTFGNEVEGDLAGTVVYQYRDYNEQSAKRGQQLCWKKVITSKFNTGYGSHWVAGDDTGKTYRLVLDGVSSDYTATRDGDVWTLSSGLSLQPVGDLMPR